MFTQKCVSGVCVSCPPCYAFPVLGERAADLRTMAKCGVDHACARGSFEHGLVFHRKLESCALRAAAVVARPQVCSAGICWDLGFAVAALSGPHLPLK